MKSRNIIEVADASEDFDRRAKLSRYAQAGIPEAWLVVLSADAVDVYNDPSPDATARTGGSGPESG